MANFYFPAAVLIVWAVLWIFHYPGIRGWWRARGPHRREISVAQANMAQDLCPLIDRYMKEGSTILIPGGDPNELFRPLYPWNRYLRKWLERGAHITYCLVEPSNHAESKLERLQREFPRLMDLRIVWSVDQIDDEKDQKLVERMRTYHTVLLENKTDDGAVERVMWIEGNHPLRSKVAYDCQFVPPAIANNDTRFDNYWKILQHVINDLAERVKSNDGSVAHG